MEGVDEAVVNDVFAEAKKFFDEPVEVKKEVGVNEHYRGKYPLYYHASTGETRKGTYKTSLTDPAKLALTDEGMSTNPSTGCYVWCG
jgi:isopenicillin N synthase-like dioxygenase